MIANGTSFTEYQTYVLSVINVTSGALSAVGASFIILCYMLMTPSRRAGVRLILILACCNLGAATGHLIFDQADNLACKCQAFILGLFEPASFYCTWWHRPVRRCGAYAAPCSRSRDLVACVYVCARACACLGLAFLAMGCLL